MPARSPDEIRTSVERTRQELIGSVEELRARVRSATDWRRQVRRHRGGATVGAAAAGFVLGGGVAALGSLVFGRADE